MNRRQASAALLLYRRQKHSRYWVHPINQSLKQFGKFHTLYTDLRKYPDRFYTYYRMSTEQFDYILAQIDHLIYKPNTNWRCSTSAEGKLAICIRYLYLLSFKSMFTLLHLLSPSWKQYYAEMAMSTVFTDVFVQFLYKY